MRTKERISQRIIIPCRITVLEALEEPDTNETGGVKVKGRLITCGVPTRNGISYTRESMERFVNFFNQQKMTLPFLDSHDDTSIRRTPPFGHVEKLWMQGDDVFYQADIDPEEKTFLHKLKRGDIREVSLQAIVDSVGEEEMLEDGESTVLADVKELLEVSSVLIPGARGTSAEMEEMYGFMSEHRFVERFRSAKRYAEKNKITFKESYKLVSKEANDDASILGGNVKPPKEEDLDTSNGGALIGTTLPKDKKIKKASELLRKARLLKITTRRLS